MKRLGIFLIYDKQGIVDNYIVYLLNEMKEVYQDLVIVCNGGINKESVMKLDSFTSRIFFRDNLGFDAGGFKDTFTKYMGWSEVAKYDEVILFNDSFFGPFYSMTDLFGVMQEKKCDFWSLTKNIGKIPGDDAIQSYFVVVRKNMLHSKSFMEYWENMPYYTLFNDVVQEYEMKFASYFEKCGYTWDSYVDSSKYDVIGGKRKDRLSLYHTVPNEIIKEQKYPFLKRKLFNFDGFEHNFGLGRQTKENFIDALNYIEKNTGYDMKLIWENVLRVYSLRNIQDNCCLRRILDYKGADCQKRIQIKNVLWLLNQPITIENLDRVLKNAAPSDIIIGTDSKEIRNYLYDQKKITDVFLFENANAFWSFIMTEFNNFFDGYDLISVFNDKKCQADFDCPYVTNFSDLWSKWENMYGMDKYVENIKKCFTDEDQLGMLVVPAARHADHFCELSTSDELRNIYGQSEIGDYIARSEYLADWSDCIWIRKKVIDDKVRSVIAGFMKNNMNFNKEIAMSLPYLCQWRGYYTTIVESSRHAGMYIDMLNIYLRYFINDSECNGKKLNFYQFEKYAKLKVLNGNKLAKFKNTHADIYIYGCGEIAEIVLKSGEVNTIKSFIVSDGHKDRESFFNYPVASLSEIEALENAGVILALNDKNALQVYDDVTQKFGRDNVLILENGGIF